MNSYSISGLTESIKERRLSESSWLIILLGILLVSGIWLFVRYQINYDYDRTIIESSRETMNLAKAFEEHVRRIISDVDDDLLEIKLVCEKEGKFSPRIVPLTIHATKDSSRGRTAICNELGVTVHSSDVNAIGVSSSTREYFLVHRETDSNKLEIGKPIIDKFDGTVVIPLTRRINKTDGSFGGFVYIGLKDSVFLSYYDQIDLGQNERISITGTDGFIRVRQAGGNAEAGQDARSTEFFRLTQSGNPVATYMLTNPFDNISRLGAYRIMPDYPLIVSVGKSMQTALADYEQRKQGYIVGASLTSLFILLFCIILVNRHEKNRGLTAAVQKEKERLSVAQEVVVTSRDALLTNEKQLMYCSEELHETNKELTSFINSIAHDFRSPMVNLKGFSRELEASLAEFQQLFRAESVPLPDKLKKKLDQLLEDDVPESLHFIYSSVDRLDRMVNSLLGLARVGKQELVIEDVDLVTLVNQVCQSFKHQIETQNICLTVGPLPTAHTDRIAVERIICNLVDNAIKYLMPGRPGKITVICQEEDARYVFSIEDNGRGVAANDHEKIFQTFGRTGQQDMPGDGMGLAYVRKLIRQIGGRVWCQSELGVGTKMVFTLPKQ